MYYEAAGWPKISLIWFHESLIQAVQIPSIGSYPEPAQSSSCEENNKYVQSFHVAVSLKVAAWKAKKEI